MSFFSLNLWLHQKVLIVLASLPFTVYSIPAIAQLVPDATLGAQSSVVQTTNFMDTIAGGHRVGNNLFHSFQEFNVEAGRSLYFADPGVANILSRVTGHHPSTIHGRIGVNGAANLFLMNPNGIIFGAGASLDVRGSFTATTANAIKFSDGSEFSATNPTAPNLLTIAVPVGLQRGIAQPAAIANRGHLQTGQDLTLDATTLDLQGQLHAGRNLNLLATNTVTVRDTIADPFVARAGGDLRIQGDRAIDILALNHLSQTPFVSGGNLTLISDRPISGDAHFVSGGSFNLLTSHQTPGNFVSLYDPIVIANGNVLFGDYTGAALKVEAGGSIQGGNIRITSPDVGIPITDPDYAQLSSSPAVILRAGLANVGAPSVPQVAGGTTFMPALTPSGNSITVSNVDTSRVDGAGGVILLEANSGNIQTGDLNSSSSVSFFGDSGNAGAITLTSGGTIQTANIDTTSIGGFFGSAGQAGTVTITGNGAIATGSVQTGASGFFTTTGAGSILLQTATGEIQTGRLAASASADYGFASSSGTISLTTGSGTIQTQAIETTALNGVGGEIVLRTGQGSIRASSLSSGSGSGFGDGLTAGRITLSATNGDIQVGDIAASSTGGLGGAAEGGAIALHTTNGNIQTGNILSTSSGVGDTGNGGTVQVTATNGAIQIRGQIDTSSISVGSNSSGTGGAITLNATDTIQAQVLTSQVVAQGTVSNAGVIALTSQTGDILAARLNTTAFSTSFSGSQTGSSGAISLIAPTGNIILGDLHSETFNTAGNGGTIQLLAGNRIQTGAVNSSTGGFNVKAGNSGAVVFAAQNDIQTGAITTTSYSVTVPGTGGNVTLTSTAGNLVTGGILASAIAPSWKTAPPDLQGQGGNVQLTAAGTINPKDWINASGISGAGNITLTSQNAFAADNVVITADTFGFGKGGNILIAAPAITLRQGSQLSAATHSTGPGGTITLQAPNFVLLQGSADEPPPGIFNIPTVTGLANIPPGLFLGGYVPTGNTFDLMEQTAGLRYPTGVFVQNTNQSTGDAGQIKIQTGQLFVQDGATIAATTFGQGNAGDIAVQARYVSLNNGSIASGVAPGASGNSGTIALAAQSLDLMNRGRIQSLTLGSGQAGEIQIQTTRTTIAGHSSGIISGSGTAEQQGGAIGDGGNIRLATDTLQVTTDGMISASTFTIGQSGNIDVTARTVELTTGGKLAATTQNQGDAGSIRVIASDRILISEQGSGIFASTAPMSSGDSGNIFLSTGQLQLQDWGRITAGTQGQGQGGDVQIVANQMELTQQASLSAETTGSGNGGNLSIRSDRLKLENQSSVSVSGQGSGSGGNLNITTNALTLNNQGRIVAETASSDGGNISLQVRDNLLLRRNSLISASAGTAQSGGNGGNVNITANFVIGVLGENSDIRANAFTGNGGRVNITAQSIFGLQFQPQDTPLSDITASSQFGISGTVTLNTLNVDPNRGLVQLPSNFAETNQVAQTCSPQQQQNSFTVTGRGGVSLNPSETLNQNELWQDKTASREKGRVQERSDHPHSTPPHPTAIAEATAWQRSPDGSISLVIEDANAAVPNSPIVCQSQVVHGVP